MPTLVQLFTDPVSLAFFALFFALWGVEALFPARALPKVPGHRARGLAGIVLFFLISSYLPYVVAPWLAPFALADLTPLGTWGGAVAAMLVYQALGYTYHRAMHSSSLLFRGLHQLHHSAERLDVASAFYFAPLDMTGWTLVSTAALTLVGVTPEATVAFVLGGTFLSVFQHANLKTPRFIGYFIQRPESHSHHHGRGVHRNNYADLPIFDILFGTFHNPKEFAPATGYYDGGSRRFGEMLLFRDVSRGGASAPERAAQRAEAAPVLSGSETH